MNLLSDQSRVIRSLHNTIEGFQNTIESLNFTIKVLNDRIEEMKLKEKDVFEDVGKEVDRNIDINVTTFSTSARLNSVPVLKNENSSKCLGESIENVHSKTVHEKAKVSNISSHKTPVQEDVEKITKFSNGIHVN